VASLLFTKASHDLNAARALIGVDNAEVGDQIFGMLLQQGVEKAAKGLLALKGHRYPFTHEIDKLLAALDSKGLALSADLEELKKLTPFASTERYETPIRTYFTPSERRVYYDKATKFLKWAMSHL
jgi:HEPN domain-containing protein